MRFSRVTVDPRQMGGVPCIRGLRIPVATVVGMVADGMSEREILEAYPDLEPEDIREVLLYAAQAMESSPPFPVGPDEGGG
ncbi:DUF433 domain-containing protein [Carboxydochorda subterranea]|uniref:DUF433 domain-containing protein n=1 Tax=Carboxydichorda subterranea TaxID=3109565 RepID=A0ABZ1BTW3_9FIRM|nr:DUF433 domain-containing protein [Limnochorda sp. L945t]WRP16065.1 DUF433 domain-containing protein [Limnochorda sp. L945t]